MTKSPQDKTAMDEATNGAKQPLNANGNAKARLESLIHCLRLNGWLPLVLGVLWALDGITWVQW